MPCEHIHTQTHTQTHTRTHTALAYTYTHNTHTHTHTHAHTHTKVRNNKILFKTEAARAVISEAQASIIKPTEKPNKVSRLGASV